MGRINRPHNLQAALGPVADDALLVFQQQPQVILRGDVGQRSQALNRLLHGGSVRITLRVKAEDADIERTQLLRRFADTFQTLAFDVDRVSHRRFADRAAHTGDADAVLPAEGFDAPDVFAGELRAINTPSGAYIDQWNFQIFAVAAVALQSQQRFRRQMR